MPNHKAKQKLFEHELPNLYEELKRDYGDVEEWLDTPHEQLLGRTPRELLGTEDEIHLCNLLRRIRHGVPT